MDRLAKPTAVRTCFWSDQSCSSTSIYSAVVVVVMVPTPPIRRLHFECNPCPRCVSLHAPSKRPLYCPTRNYIPAERETRVSVNNTALSWPADRTMRPPATLALSGRQRRSSLFFLSLSLFPGSTHFPFHRARQRVAQWFFMKRERERERERERKEGRESVGVRARAPRWQRIERGRAEKMRDKKHLLYRPVEF